MPLAQTVQSIRQGLTSEVRDIASSLSSKLSGIVGGISARVGSLIEGDVVGINEAEIPTMKTAIQTYVDALSEHLKEINAAADTSGAFKGQYADAIKEYTTAITTVCDAVISQLLKFRDQLDEIAEAYVANDESLASGVNAQASELSSAYQRYE